MAFLFFMVFFRFAMAYRFMFLILLVIAGLALAAYSIYNWRQRKKHLASPEGKAEMRIQICQQEIEKIEQELIGVEKELAELRQDLLKAQSPTDKAKAEKLIKGFESERNIRKAKILFLNTAVHKLQAMLQKRQLKQELEDKQEKLQALQEGHYEDIAELEALRSDLEMDAFLLDDIETLSLETLQSNSLDRIELLRAELENMTNDLNRDT